MGSICELMSHIKAIQNPHISHRLSHTIPIFGPCMFHINSFGNESGVLSHSTMGEALEADQLNLPNPEPLEGWEDHPFPYFLIGDEAFALKQWMQSLISGRELPEDQRIFNYHLSCARRVIENAFGILAARWRIFCRPI